MTTCPLLTFCSLIFHLEIIISAAFFWLGAYVITQAWLAAESESFWKWFSLQAGGTMIIASVFLLGTAMRFVSGEPAEYVFWEKATWWALPLGCALWFRVILLLSLGKTAVSPSHGKQLITLFIFLYAFLLVYLSVGTNVIHLYEEARVQTNAFGTVFLPPNLPTYHLFTGFFLFTIYGSLWLVWRRWQETEHTNEKQQMLWLWRGTTLVAMGASGNLLNYLYLNGRFSVQLGDTLAAIGLALIGYSIAHYNALLNSAIRQLEFNFSLYRAGLTILLFLFIFHAAHYLTNVTVSKVSVPTVVMLAIAANTFLSLAYNWWAERRGVRKKVRLQTAAGSIVVYVPTVVEEELKRPFSSTIQPPSALWRQTIEREIEKIFRFTSFHKDEIMGHSSLLELKAMQEKLQAFAQTYQIPTTSISENDKAELLRHYLEHFIQQNLRPTSSEPARGEYSEEWIIYLILQEKYVNRLTRAELETRFNLLNHRVSEGRAFAQHLKKARKRLTQLLWQADQKIERNRTTFSLVWPN